MQVNDSLSMMNMKMLEGFKSEDFNMEILTLFAKELDSERRDTHYKPPFSVAHKKALGDEDGDANLVEADSE
jgi:hypothetical protein